MKNEPNKAVERSRLLGAVRAFSSLREGTNCAKQPSRSLLTLGKNHEQRSIFKHDGATSDSGGRGLQEAHLLPAFILFYSSIDILASLTRPKNQEDTTGAIFRNWVAKYMIGDRSYVWNADDLWGARCGLLHTFTVQSRSSRTGGARELHYISDKGFCDFVQKETDPLAEDKVFVFLNELIIAFIDGIEAFAKDIQTNHELQDVVLHHSAKLIIHERRKTA